MRALWCFWMFLIPKNYAKLCYHDFCLKFCPTLPKFFLRQLVCVSESFWYRKTLYMRGGILIFCRNFLSHRIKTIRRGALPGFKNILYRKLSCIRGGVSRFSMELNLINCSKCWVSNPYQVFQNPVVLPNHYAMGTNGISDKCHWHRKTIWHERDSNPDLHLEKFLY